MGERIVSENPHVQSVSYALPNKHYIPVDMRYAGIDNLTPCVISPLFLLFYCSSFLLRFLRRLLVSRLWLSLCLCL